VEGSDCGDAFPDFVTPLGAMGAPSEVHESSSRKHRTPLTLKISPFCSQSASHIAHYFENPWRSRMSTKPSELMLAMLKELRLIKELDQQYEKGPRSGVEVVEFESRENRRREISDQMKALAEQ
jgi:hypothetical protein